MGYNYKKKSTKDYVVLKNPVMMKVMDGQRQEIEDAKNINDHTDSYIIGYNTLNELKKLITDNTKEIEYSDLNKLLRKLFPDITPKTLEGYAEAFSLKSKEEVEQLSDLYEILKATVEEHNLEDSIYGDEKLKEKISKEEAMSAWVLAEGNKEDGTEEMKEHDYGDWNDIETEEIESFDQTEENKWGGLDGLLDDEEDNLFNQPEDEDKDQPEDDLGFEEFLNNNFEEFDDVDSLDEPEEVEFAEQEDETEETDPEEIEDFDDNEPEETGEDENDQDTDFAQQEEDEIGFVEIEDLNEKKQEDFDFDLPEGVDIKQPINNPETINLRFTEEPVEEAIEVDFVYEDVMNELEGIYNKYHDNGHFLWTKWMGQQLSKYEEDPSENIMDLFHKASAELTGNYLKEFYFHLRDDLHATMPEEVQEMSAKTQIMCMAMDIVENREGSRIYSEMVEGIYGECVLSNPESRQVVEMQQLEYSQDLSDDWKETYAPLLGKTNFPLGQEIPPVPEHSTPVFAPEIDVDLDFSKEPNYKEKIVLNEPLEAVDIENLEPANTPEEESKMEEGYISNTKIKKEDLYFNDFDQVMEENRSTDRPYEVPADVPKEKPKKKHRVLKGILWAVLIASIGGLTFGCYHFYKNSEIIKADNVKLSYDLKQANNLIKELRGLEDYKLNQEDFNRAVSKQYKAKKYANVKLLIESYYGTDDTEMPDSIAPIYRAVQKALGKR